MPNSAFRKPFNLSKREREILQWTACGKTSDEIAVLLNLEETTVNTYVRRACTKLDAVNKTHAVTLVIVQALKIGLSSSLTTILPYLFGVSNPRLEIQTANDSRDAADEDEQ